MKKKLKNLTLAKAVVSNLTYEKSVSIHGGRDGRSISGLQVCQTNCPCSNGPNCTSFLVCE
jgi:hypothetical protein